MNRKNTCPLTPIHPMANISKSDAERIEHVVVLARLHLYNQDMPCGAIALRQYLADHEEIAPLPSVHQIGVILNQYGLSHQRTGWYEGEETEWLPIAARMPVMQRKEVPRA